MEKNIKKTSTERVITRICIMDFDYMSKIDNLNKNKNS